MFSADVGRNSGAIVDVISRSGTNEIHGSAFEFLRNSWLDARSFFNVKGTPFPSFKFNQFGGWPPKSEWCAVLTAKPTRSPSKKTGLMIKILGDMHPAIEGISPARGGTSTRCTESPCVFSCGEFVRHRCITFFEKPKALVERYLRFEVCRRALSRANHGGCRRSKNAAHIVMCGEV